MNIHSTFRQKSKTNTKYKNKPLFDNELFSSTNDLPFHINILNLTLFQRGPVSTNTAYVTRR